MRRYRLVPLLAVALTLGACGTNTPSEPRTVTEIVTQTGTPPTTDSSDGITVVNPSGGASGSGTASGSGSAESGSTGSQSGSAPTTTPTTTPSTGASGTKSGSSGTATQTATSSTSAKPTKKTSSSDVVKVNPLQVSCASLLDSNDIKKALGVKVSSANSRIVDVPNPDVKMTGKIKCYFGAKTGSKSQPVTVALAQYASKKAARDQMNVTVHSEKSLGADASVVQVSGRDANVLLRNGGLLIMPYDTWTLSIAVENKLVKASKLPDGLQAMARMVLARVIKNG